MQIRLDRPFPLTVQLAFPNIHKVFHLAHFLTDTITVALKNQQILNFSRKHSYALQACAIWGLLFHLAIYGHANTSEQ